MNRIGLVILLVATWLFIDTMVYTGSWIAIVVSSSITLAAYGYLLYTHHWSPRNFLMYVWHARLPLRTNNNDN